MKQPVDQLLSDLQSRIDYFREEYDLSYAEVLGTFEILKAELLAEALEDDEDAARN